MSGLCSVLIFDIQRFHCTCVKNIGVFYCTNNKNIGVQRLYVTLYW